MLSAATREKSRLCETSFGPEQKTTGVLQIQTKWRNRFRPEQSSSGAWRTRARDSGYDSKQTKACCLKCYPDRSNQAQVWFKAAQMSPMGNSDESKWFKEHVRPEQSILCVIPDEVTSMWIPMRARDLRSDSDKAKWSVAQIRPE